VEVVQEVQMPLTQEQELLVVVEGVMAVSKHLPVLVLWTLQRGMALMAPRAVQEVVLAIGQQQIQALMVLPRSIMVEAVEVEVQANWVVLRAVREVTALSSSRTTKQQRYLR
jgi:hypothetical protein